jgi:hypothetical protein
MSESHRAAGGALLSRDPYASEQDIREISGSDLFFYDPAFGGLFVSAQPG